jgi:hypothetical protein
MPKRVNLASVFALGWKIWGIALSGSTGPDLRRNANRGQAEKGQQNSFRMTADPAIHQSIHM